MKVVCSWCEAEGKPALVRKRDTTQLEGLLGALEHDYFWETHWPKGTAPSSLWPTEAAAGPQSV